MIFSWTFEFFSTAMSLRAKQSTKHWHWTDTLMEGNLLLARSNWANAEQMLSKWPPIIHSQSLATGKWVAAQYELGWRIVGTGTSVWPFVSSSWSDQIYPLVNIQKAIEHGPVEIVDLPPKNGVFPSFFLCLPEGTGEGPKIITWKNGSVTVSDVWVSPSWEEPGYRHRKVAARVQVGLEQTGGRGARWA